MPGAEGLPRQRVGPEIAHLARVAWPAGGGRVGTVDLEAATEYVVADQQGRGWPFVAG